jgi:hypothetical protein
MFRVDHALSIHRVAIHRVMGTADVENDIRPTVGEGFITAVAAQSTAE